MSDARRSRLKQSGRFAAGIAAVVLTFLIRHAVFRYSGVNLPPYAVFFPAITFTALFAGFWAGLLASLAAALLVASELLFPQGRFVFHWGAFACLLLFAGIGTLTSGVCELHRRARRKLASCERQIAGQRAQDAVRRYELLAENSRDIILFIKRGGGRILEANAAAVACYGYSREELLELTIHDLRAPDSSPLSPKQLAEADRRGIRFEGVQRRKDGSTFPVEVNSQGAVLGDTPVLISVIRDISDRKKTEAAIAGLNQDLQRRAAELQAIFDTAPIGLAICQDAEGRHIKGNPANERLLGVAAGEELSAKGNKLRYRPMKDGRELDPSDLPMQRAVRGEAVSGAMLDIVRPDGNLISVFASAVPLFDEQNRPRGAVGAFMDITPLKAAQEALQEASEHRRLAIDGAELGCWDFQLGGEIYWDERCLRMFGFSSGERISKEAVLACLHPEDRRAIISAGRDAMMNGGGFHCEFRVIWPDGSVHWLAGHARVYCKSVAGIPLPRRISGITMDITEHRKAVEALRQSEQWLQVTLASIGEAVIATDNNGCVTFMNAAAAALTGWGTEQATGQPVSRVFRVFDEQRGALAEDIVERVLRDGSTRQLANHAALMARDGRLVPIEDSVAPIRDGQGDIVGAVLVFRDVTEQRRAQKALRQSEERHRRLVDLSPNAIYVHREDRIEFVNPAALKLLGAAAPEQLIGKSPLEIFHADYHDLIRERIGRLRQDEPIAAIEEKVVRLDGRTVDVEVTASRFVDQNGPAIQVLMRDITGRRQREEQARRFNRTLKALNNSNQALLRATSEQGLLEQVCQIITEDCGYAMVWIGFAENDEQKSVRPVAYAGFEKGYLEGLGITWADSERGRGPTGTAIRTGQPAMCADMLSDPAFTPWRAEALRRGYRSSLVLPLMNEGKAFGSITLYSSEPNAFSEEEIKLLTELAADLSYGIGALRLRAAHELAQEALIRSEKLASVGRMAATIAHEINNPLAAVMNTLYLARYSDGLPEQARQYLEVCDAELKRISHITRQALGFYRESTAPAMTSIGGILDSVLDLLATKIVAKRVTVARQYDHELQVVAVAGELRQVFSNLVSNSLDAVGEGGTIKLRASAARGAIRITVADNGDGIPATALPRIFEPFFTTKVSVGTGLGLWVSKQIVEKHGGSIRLHSCTSGPRQGTAFSISLPQGAAGMAQAAGN